jgi:hypothetical protein
MVRKLRAVGPDETGELDPPKNLVEATGRSRREFLVMARRRIAEEIDGGSVPAHALGRLIAELERLDTEVRRLDTADAQEAGRRGPVEDGAFDAAAI